VNERMGSGREPKWGRVWRYEGTRGVVWRIRYRDATGRRILETLGKEPAWNRKKAEAELRRRLVDVERDGYRKPERLLFADFAQRWQTEYLPGRGLKLTTLDGYQQALAKHLLPYFGPISLQELEQRPELIDRYIAQKMQAGLAPKTVTNHLLILQGMLKRAVRWRLIERNPVLDADRPRLHQPELNILTQTEIARLWTAYQQLEHDAGPDQQPWWRLSRAPSPSSRSAPPCAAANSSPSAGKTSTSSTVTSRCAKHSSKVASPHQNRAARGDCSSSAPKRATCSADTGNERRSEATRNSSSAIPRRAPRSTPPNSPGSICDPHYNTPESPNQSDRSTTSATLPSPTKRRPATQWPTSNKKPATPKRPSPNATFTPPKSSSRAPPPKAKQASSHRPTDDTRLLASRLALTTVLRLRPLGRRTSLRLANRRQKMRLKASPSSHPCG
jgi:hypothetical protein